MTRINTSWQRRAKRRLVRQFNSLEGFWKSTTQLQINDPSGRGVGDIRLTITGDIHLWQYEDWSESKYFTRALAPLHMEVDEWTKDGQMLKTAFELIAKPVAGVMHLEARELGNPNANVSQLTCRIEISKTFSLHGSLHIDNRTLVDPIFIREGPFMLAGFRDSDND